MAKYQQPNMANLMKQAQKMKAQVAMAQQQLSEMTFEGIAGGSAVKIVVNGNRKAQSVYIDKELLNEQDAEMLCDMICAAFNDACEKVDTETESKLGGVTGGMGIPGM